MPIQALSDPDVTTISGNLIVAKSARTGDAGKINSDGGAFASDGSGNVTVNSLLGFLGLLGGTRNTGTAPTLASSGTIACTSLISRVTTGGAVTGAIIATGTVNGQILIVVNESANTITMATAATSHVLSGTTNVIVANGGAVYVWDDLASTARWVCVAMGL